ncbi:tetratricopeptide repeat protein [Tissierella sp. MB52-C2]|uniref:tetratricopeptide repeat protein n=1 Tax=Tissierella sp. MB52-C2 TaxID=3070999 RepID=UPI00280ACBED|nr:tetratricopeptide repeat protein [Tissierella sp. MB52-C2]WMM27021.1 tetratricopeptide repeat protein [Tissierella sp. MB52-C2]
MAISEPNPGGIIKRIREMLNIIQSDTTEGNNTSKLIDLVESGKVPLKIDNAELICKDINDILEERNMDLIIEPEDLLNPQRYEAKEKVENYIAKLDKHKNQEDYVIDLDDLDDLEFLLNEYNLMDKKIKAYEIIGDIYFNSRDYDKEYEYMLKAWELTARYPKRKFNYRIMIKLSSNYIDRGKYQDAITLYQKALVNISEIPEKYLIHLYYNYALAFFRSKMYFPALEVISDLLCHTERKDYDLWRRAYNLQGLCHLEMGDYESSLNSYNNALQVLTFTGYSDHKYLVYGNIAEVYTKLKDENRAYKYLDWILKDMDELDKSSDNYSAICNQLAISYEYLGEFEQAEKYYKESLKYAKKNVQQNYIFKNIISLIELNTKIKIDDICEIMEEYNDDIISGMKFNDGKLTVFRCLKTYVDNQDYNRFEKLIDNIIKYQGGEGI